MNKFPLYEQIFSFWNDSVRVHNGLKEDVVHFPDNARNKYKK